PEADAAHRAFGGTARVPAAHRATARVPAAHGGAAGTADVPAAGRAAVGTRFLPASQYSCAGPAAVADFVVAVEGAARGAQLGRDAPARDIAHVADAAGLALGSELACTVRCAYLTGAAVGAGAGKAAEAGCRVAGSANAATIPRHVPTSVQSSMSRRVRV